MKNCSYFTKMFSHYIDDLLETKEVIVLETHLSSCPQCHKKFENMKNIKRSMANLPKASASDSFDAVMHARLRQQIRHENKRSGLQRFPRFFEHLKAPAFAVAAVTLVFFGAMLQRFYGTSPSMASMDAQILNTRQNVAQNVKVADPGYLVVSKLDTANNRIVITNYPDIDEFAPAQNNLRRRTINQMTVNTSLPNLKEAPTERVYRTSMHPNANRPGIQLAKEYVF